MKPLDRAAPAGAVQSLRTAPRRIGDAVICGTCDGDGLVIVAAGWWGLDTKLLEPMKCPDCGGEGLDPSVQHGS